jgi:signal peptidase II
MIQIEKLEIEATPKPLKYFALALMIILLDQASKLLVQKYMYLHQEITLLGFGDGQYGFKLHYLLNPGMAFGIRWDSEFGKLALTSFRIIAMFGIAYYLIRSAAKKIHNGFLVSLSLILGGAVGNVIDSTFYGVLFHNQPIESVTPWFHGQVIDMLFFPLFDFIWPSWMPFWGGEEFLFFSPVFNIADSSIFIGVATILLYQKRFFPEAHRHEFESKSEEDKIEGPIESSNAAAIPLIISSGNFVEEKNAEPESFEPPAPDSTSTQSYNSQSTTLDVD